jgi:monoamine oxidase
LLGRSEQLDVTEALESDRAKRHLGRRQKEDDESIEMTPEAGFDVLGPWFDGVAALEGTNPGHVDVKAAKSKEVAIVGAGMSGLMSYLVLSQAGLTNITLLEASSRLGGRVQTTYLSGGPSDYSYQEMGPMRVPHLITYGNTTYKISEQYLFFRLAEELNTINEDQGHEDLGINLIPWIQNSANGLQYFNENKMPNGLPPTVGDVLNDPSLGQTRPEIPESASELRAQLNALQPGSEFLEEIAANMWAAHSRFISASLMIPLPPPGLFYMSRG